MKLKDALEIVLGLAKDNTLDVPTEEGLGSESLHPHAVIEAAEAQGEAIKEVEKWWKEMP